MSSGQDYNWAMTGPPEGPVSQEAAASYNDYAAAVNSGAVESNSAGPAPYIDSGGNQTSVNPDSGGGGDTAAVVQQMYQDILGRPADAAGQQAFVDAINSGADVGALAASMAASAEAQQRGITQQASNAANHIANLGDAYVSQVTTATANKDYVTNLYYGVFGRAPDAAGLANNVALLNQGKISPDQLAASFAGSPEAAKDGIPAAQQQQIAQQIAGNYGATSSNKKIDTATGDWSSVSAADLVKAGITNKAILMAAATGQLNDNIFGSFKVDANVVANAMNAGVAVPTQTTSALNSATNIAGMPTGQIVSKTADASGGTVYHYSNGGSVLYDAQGNPVSIGLGTSAYRNAGNGMAVADNPGVALFNGKLVTVQTPHYQWSGNGVQIQGNGIPKGYDAPSSGGIGGALESFDKTVRDTVPGGWVTVAALAAGAATLGAGAFAAAGTDVTATIAADAASMAAAGTSATDIAATLAANYGMDAATAGALASSATTTVATGGITAASLEAAGMTAAQAAALTSGSAAASGVGIGASLSNAITSLASNVPALGQIAGLGPMVQGAVVGGTLGGASAAITGNNILKGVLGGVAGGLTGGAVSGLASGLGATGAGILGGMTGGGVTSAINGAPIMSGVLGGGVAGGLGGYLNGPGASSLTSGNNQLASQVYGGMAGGAVNAAVQKGNILTGALGGAAFGGLANYLVNATAGIATSLGGEATPGVPKEEIAPERQQAFAKAAATVIANGDGTTTYIFPDNTSLIYNDTTGQVINTQANGGNYTAGNGQNGTEFGKFYLLNEDGSLMTTGAGKAIEAPSSVKIGSGFTGGIGGGTQNGFNGLDYAATPGYTAYGDGTNGTTMGSLYYLNGAGEYLTLNGQPVSVESQFGKMTAVAPQGTVYGNPSVPGGGDYGKNYIAGPNGLPAIDPYGNLIETGKALSSGIPGTNLTPAQISGLIASQNAGGQIGKNGLVNFLKSGQATSTGTTATYTAPKLKTLTGGLENPGLNPGWMNQGVTPFYATNSPVQSQFYWGGHPYMPDYNSLVNYNNVPSAPTTPWGVQQGQQSYDINTLLKGIQSYDQIAGTKTPTAPVNPLIGANGTTIASTQLNPSALTPAMAQQPVAPTTPVNTTPINTQPMLGADQSSWSPTPFVPEEPAAAAPVAPVAPTAPAEVPVPIQQPAAPVVPTVAQQPAAPAAPAYSLVGTSSVWDPVKGQDTGTLYDYGTAKQYVGPSGTYYYTPNGSGWSATPISGLPIPA